MSKGMTFTKVAAVAITITAAASLFFSHGVDAQGKLLNPRPVTLDREVSIYSDGVDVCGVYQAEAAGIYRNARSNAVTMQIGGQYSFLYQVSAPNGGGPLSALIDPTGSGLQFPVQATVKNNVAGTSGILVAPESGQFPLKANITIELPGQINCVASDGLCLMVIANGQGVGSCIFFRVIGGFNNFGGYNGASQYGGGMGAINTVGQIGNQAGYNGANQYPGAAGTFNGVSQNGNQAGYNGANQYPGAAGTFNQVDKSGMQGGYSGYNGYNGYSNGYEDYQDSPITSQRMDELQRSFTEQQKRVSNLLYYRYDPNDIKPQIMSLLDVYMEIPEYLRDPILPYSKLRLTATQVLQLAQLIPQNLIPRELYAEARRVLLKYLADRKAAQAKKTSTAPAVISNLASSGIRSSSL